MVNIISRKCGNSKTAIIFNNVMFDKPLDY